MLKIDNIKDVGFTYYDENGYTYSFSQTKTPREIKNENEGRFYLQCNETNSSANGENYLVLKTEGEKLYARTDYFVSATNFFELNKTEDNTIYSIDFGKDTLELKLDF